MLTLKACHHLLHVFLRLDVVVISILIGEGFLAGAARNLPLGAVWCLRVLVHCGGHGREEQYVCVCVDAKWIL